MPVFVAMRKVKRHRYECEESEVTLCSVSPDRLYPNFTAIHLALARWC